MRSSTLIDTINNGTTCPSVLVVDDEPDNVSLMEAYLALDYIIIPAYSGEQALEKVQTEIPDIVLLDMMMPGINGHEVCKTLRKDPQTCDIPIVMFSALEKREGHTKCLRAGADAFLEKPIDAVQLVNTIRALIERSEAK